ncbi:MAG: type I restriction endonuclease subunit R [Clostridium sp.]|nr:type I restriction endonuclease subunit R [Clostridium sp.]
MSRFNEPQLEQVFVELFKEQGYDYVHGSNLIRDVRDVLLYDDLSSFLREQYKHEDITDSEITTAIHTLEATDGGGVYPENVEAIRMIMEGFPIKREDPTKPNLYINLIDYERPSCNLFKFVNQLEIDGEQKRIPDGIVFVNGIPLVVLEFKSAIKEDTTIENAYAQLTVCYRRDIPKLFRYNAFVIISDGVNNKFGSLFASYEFFYTWRKVEHDAQEAEGGFNSMFTMMHGLFRKERLIEIVHNFIFFPNTPKDEDKIVCRYPQYFATKLLFDNILRHSRLDPDGDGKGGTYFGATGCGKSYTMLYLTRQLMRSKQLSSPTIVLITDRKDLDDQLAKQFLNAKKFIGDETVVQVKSREELSELLQGRTSGGVFLTTIQKFEESTGLLSDRANIICISDEAHRSQAGLGQKTIITDKGVKKHYGFAKYLRDSFPNATYVGFTGTPLDNTIDVFGPIVARYTMTEAVADGITRKIVYEGRAAKVILDSSKVKEIEKYYSQCQDEGATDYQVEKSKKQMTRIDVILNDPDLLAKIAEDIIAHYEKRIAEGSTVEGKAMIVCSSRSIAWNLYQAITKLRPAWEEVKECIEGETLTDKEKKEIKPMPRIAMVLTREKNDEPQLYKLLGTDEYRKSLNKQFKAVKSNFKIAIVVDMWITGFDVPCLDTMYCFKPLQMHTLVQTISRVNRVYPGKEKGLVVDYLGIKKQMNAALHHYVGGDVDGNSIDSIEQSLKILKDELDIIRRMFTGFDRSVYFTGQPLEQLHCLNNAAEYIQRTKESETKFMRHCKKMREAYNICCNSEQITSEEDDDIHFFFAVRSVIFKLTRGEAPDATKMNKRVLEMIKDALTSEAVKKIANIGVASDKEIDLLSADYMKWLSQIPYKNTKVKLMEQLLKKVIESLRKINKAKGIDFTKRLEEIVKKYNDRSDDITRANDIIDEVIEQMVSLMSEVNNARTAGESIGLDFKEMAFFDILKSVAVKYDFVSDFSDEKLTDLSKQVKQLVEQQATVADWSNRTDLQAELKMNIIVLLATAGYPPKIHDEVFKEILEQAENFKRHSQSRPYVIDNNPYSSMVAEP